MSLPFPDGTIVQNRYRIQRMLGQGGFGRTYLAEDTNRFNETCVLKEFEPASQGSKHAQKAEELFTREAKVLHQLHHPQIPQFRELFQIKTQNRELFFLVQDYVAGKTYEQLLNDRRNRGMTFSESEAVQLLQQLLPVLDYIHRSGIVHRDISPDNIILRDLDQKPVLIDFGVVKAAATQAVHSGQTLVGKPGYAPIEQLHKGSADSSSDLYALAVTIIVLLTGREAQSLFDSMNMTCQWKKYTNASPAFAQVIDRMLSNRPRDRYPAAQEVMEALSRVSSGSMVLTHAPVPIPPPIPPNSTHSTHQGTVALAGKRHRRSTVANSTTTGTYPRPWFESAFDVPLALFHGAYKLLKWMFRAMFGIVRLTMFGMTKLVVRVLLWILAIVSFIWLVPQVFPYVAKSVPDFSKAVPDFSKAVPDFSKVLPKPTSVQAIDYEAECRKLGIDYNDFIAQVNDEFYRKFPARRGKPLTQSQADEKFRSEWHRIAQNLLSEKSGDLKSQRKVAEDSNF
ncbi:MULTISPECIES: serine/threonine-protein kinase [Leptolyngbya]|uniref:serine/threonine-protein kinase n=1 Tax=Leptolyngbya TaxID=47251 RepID=UPI0016864D1C|nr:serine/threonine-protein kinase [Leptolyngbya sp. FACHB-1624]MBD1859028.1 serine/threonine protein kinase [Leptolyngbya sp. FACHB-1624]